MPTQGWLFTVREIGETCPSVDPLLLKQCWEHRWKGAPSARRSIFDDALSRVNEVNRLVHFGYHTLQDVEWQAADNTNRQRTVLFKWRAPASYRDKIAYQVWAEMSVSNLPGLHPFCCKIVRSGCECPCRDSADCVHLLMLMMVIHTLPRPDSLGIQKPCTSRRCEWIDPGNGDTYNVMTPLPRIPFLRDSMLSKKRRGKAGIRVGNNGAKNKAFSSARCTEGMRHEFCPLATVHQEALQDRDNHVRVAARERFFSVQRKAIGEPCAAEVTWGQKFIYRLAPSPSPSLTSSSASNDSLYRGF